jgi:hypothetical protein
LTVDYSHGSVVLTIEATERDSELALYLGEVVDSACVIAATLGPRRPSRRDVPDGAPR